MKRRHAILLGVLWLTGLVALDLWLVFQPGNLRRLIDAALEDTFSCEHHYADFSVSPSGSVVLRDLRLMRPDDPAETMMRVPELRVTLDWTSLLRLAPRVGQVELLRPEIVLAWDAAGDLALPSPFRADDAPRANEVPRVLVKGLDLWLRQSPYLTRADVHLPLDDLAVELLPDVGDRWLFAFSARVEDDLVGRLEAHGQVSETEYRIEMERTGFLVSERMLDLLEPRVAGFLGRVDVGGPVRLSTRFAQAAGADRTRFDVVASFDGVDLSYSGFPQSVSGLTGRVRYADGRFETESLSGAVEGGRFSLSGTVDLSETATPINVEGRILGLDLSDAFVHRLSELPHPGPVASEQLERFRVRGPIDLDFTVKQERGRDVRPYLEVALRGCDFEFRGSESEPGGERVGFHYPVHGMEGLVRLDDEGLSFDRVTARRGTLGVRARGKVDYRAGQRDTWDVNIGVTAIKIDEAMLQAIDEETRETLRSLHAEGYVDAGIHVYRRLSDEVEPPPEIEVDLGGVSLRYEGFPFALDDVRGRVRAVGDDVEVGPLVARHGAATIVVSGRLGVGEKDGQVRLNVRAEDLPLTEDLYRALDVPLPEVAREVRRLGGEGRVEVNLRLRKAGPGQRLVARGGVTLLGITLRPADPPVVVTDVDGIVEIDGADLNILRGMTGNFAGERFNVSGAFPGAGGFEVRLEAADFALDDEFLIALQDLVPPLRDPEVRPRLEGRASATVGVLDLGSGPVVDAAVTVSGLRFQPAHWPDDVWLEDVSCGIRARQGLVKVSDLVASLRPPDRAPVRVEPERTSGAAPFDTGRKIEVHADSVSLRALEDGIDLSFGGVRLFEVPLAPWITELAGVRLSDAARALPPMTGEVDLYVSSARIRPADLLVTGGILRVSGLHVGSEGDFYLESGAIEELGIVVGPRNTSFEGRLEGTNLRLAGVGFPRFRGQFTGAREGFVVRGLDADVFGYEDGNTERPLGRLDPEGSLASLNWSEGSFDLQGRLQEVRLGPTITALGGHPGKVRGRLNARLRLGGRLGRAESWVGSGNVSADAHNLVALPLFLNIIKALDVTSWLTRSTRTRIGVDFTVKDRRIRLDRAELTSSDLDLKGDGAITFGGVIHARLEATHKGGIPLVSDILGVVPSLLLSGVVVEGPLEDPKVTARSLGMGSADGPMPSGRRPRVKGLKKDG